MPNYNDEISFSYLFSIAKKSFKRAMIYLLASVLFVTVVLITVQSLTSYNASTSTLYLSNKTNVSQQAVINNKAYAVQSALENEAFQDKDEEFAKSVQNALTVNAIVPEEIDAETEFVPTSYVLTLNGEKIEGLTIEEQTTLLQLITTELLNSFVLSELPNAEIYNSLENDLNTSEFFQIADEIYLQAETVSSAINTQITTAVNATKYKDPESGKSLADVSSAFKLILKRIDNLKTNIVTNKTQNLGSLQNYLNTKKAQANAEKTAYDAAVTSSQNALDAFPSGVSGGTAGNTYVIDAEAYENLVKEHNKYVSLAAVAAQELQSYTSYLTTFESGYTGTDTTTAEDKTATKNALKSICDDLNAELTSYKTLAEAYNQSAFLSSEMKILNPARSYSESAISTTTLLGGIAITAIIAYAIAYFQVYGKMKKTKETEDIKF